MDNPNIIFSYLFANAWGMPISRVSVTGQERRNLVCEMANERDDALVETLPLEVLCQIAEVTSKDDRLASIDPDDLADDEGSLCVLDGFVNHFTFWCRGASRSFSISNAAYLRDVKTRNSGYILKKFDQVTRILVRNGVSKKYFRLG